MVRDNPIFEGLPLWDGVDSALVGVGTRCGTPLVAVYEYEKLVQCFINEACDEDCAREWVDYNILGAYIGPDTPIIIYPLETDS